MLDSDLDLGLGVAVVGKQRGNLDGTAKGCVETVETGVLR